MSCSLYPWSLVPGIVPGTSKVLKNIGQMYVQKKIRSWAFQINDLFSLNTALCGLRNQGIPQKIYTKILVM